MLCCGTMDTERYRTCTLKATTSDAESLRAYNRIEEITGTEREHAMSIIELEKVLNGLSEDNFQAAVKYIMYLSDTQNENGTGNPGMRTLGLAKGEFEVPDNIDSCNDEIAEMFGVA